MLFLFHGHNAPAIKTVLGALLIVAGLVISDGAILAGIGAVLVVWGAFGALNAHRSARRIGPRDGMK